MKPWLWALLILFAALPAPARADQFKPAYLYLEQTGADRYDVLWKVPALDETTTLAVKPVLPKGTQDLSPRLSSYAAGATVIRWTIRVPGGLEGKTISLTNLSKTGLDALVRYKRADGTEQVGRVLGINPTFAVKASPGPFEVVVAYTRIGIEHILTGVDHLLFVLSLMIIVQGRRRLLATVTAFTIAHSITLALATLGAIHVPSPPVEATIALSIVFVASEILHRRQGRVGLAARKPWIIAFCFGLLHGLGFAGALAEVGLPQNAIPLALLFFNVGVEIGQIIFIAFILSIAFAGRKLVRDIRVHDWAVSATTYFIGTAACFWVFERIAVF